MFPEKYAGIFDHIPNLKILNYLSDCSRLDTTPYCCEYTLIKQIDGDRFRHGLCALSEKQFAEIVKHFQYNKTPFAKKLERGFQGVEKVDTLSSKSHFIQDFDE